MRLYKTREREQGDNIMILKVATDYTKTPGGRFISEGPYSGQDFREKFLYPKFEEAIKKDEELLVDLDGGYGYATSFLEEAFGGLARQTKNPRVLDIKIKSDDEEGLIPRIRDYIQNGLKTSK